MTPQQIQFEREKFEAPFPAVMLEKEGEDQAYVNTAVYAQWKGWLARATASEAESKLAAAAMAEKCIEAMGRADGMVERGRKNAEAIIRSISPAGVLESHDQAVRLTEAQQWSNRISKAIADVDSADELVDWGRRRLAALRTTPQPTAVKEPTNG